jgi:hypothetical protein
MVEVPSQERPLTAILGWFDLHSCAYLWCKGAAVHVLRLSVASASVFGGEGRQGVV